MKKQKKQKKLLYIAVIVFLIAIAISFAVLLILQKCFLPSLILNSKSKLREELEQTILLKKWILLAD